ncbi:MAG: cytochrome c oxidase subunit II [Candidatus Sericytochromatia bacterium]|nr:cytochrome c oxidase subunit II [Candidatus Sericytochromatia bacterium]
MHHPPSSWPLGRFALLFLAALFPLCFTGAAIAAPFGYVDSVTVFGDINNSLYQLMMWICIGILVVVEVALVYALVKFRKKPGENREPASWSHNTTLEVVWTIIPFVLLIIICVPTFQGLMYMANLPKKPDLVLEVVGRQFFWEYRYPELNATFSSTMRTEAVSKIQKGTKEWDDIALYIPTGRKILVKFTAADVIHSWWVPAFGMQQMTTPGNLVQFPLEVKQTGSWEGACAYLCGAFHGAMDIKVKGVDAPTFDAWVAAHKAPSAIEPFESVGKIGAVFKKPALPAHGAGEPAAGEHAAGEHAVPASAAPAAAPSAVTEAPAAPVDTAALVKAGEAVYTSRCAGCHQPAGTGMAPMFPPLAGAEQVNGSDDEVIDILLKGKVGPMTVKGTQYNGQMPAFGGQLSDTEIAAVISFVRSSWGNTAKPITPDQVKARR